MNAPPRSYRTARRGAALERAAGLDGDFYPLCTADIGLGGMCGLPMTSTPNTASTTVCLADGWCYGAPHDTHNRSAKREEGQCLPDLP